MQRDSCNDAEEVKMEGGRVRGGGKEEAALTLPTDVASSKVARQFAIL